MQPTDQPQTPVEPTVPAVDATSPPSPAPVAPEPVAEIPAPEVSVVPAPVPDPKPVDPAAQKGKRVLLVEDDDSLANVYLTRLQSEGFDARRVGNGEDALTVALEYKPDLVVLDVMMPRVSGFDVLDILRNTPETSHLKVVMLTALSQESDQERAKSLGVDDYLVKSQVVIADVIDRIRQHLATD